MNTKILALAMVALMLTVAVPATTADTWSGRRAAWLNRKADFNTARSEWLSAVADFQRARAAWITNRDASSLADLVSKAKAAAGKASDMMLKYVDQLKSSVAATRGLTDNEKAALSAELDNYISVLQGYKDSISSTDNRQQLKTLSQEMWEYWKSIRVRVKYMTARLMVAAAEVALWRGQAFASRLEAKIQQLKDNGVDTTQLDTWLASFNSKLDTVQQRIENAKINVEQITDNVTFGEIFRAATLHVRTAVSYLKEAFRDLRNIIVDMRTRYGSVTITGSGTLVAQGSGSAYLQGTGLVKITAMENSVLIVSSNANVTASGTGTKTTLDNGDVQYTGYGSARIRGHDIWVSLTGNNIKLYAHGRGTVTLTGTGTYRTFGENKYENRAWAGAVATIETGVVSG
ncbi:MAG: hypothetical protein AB1305_03225 [Candidatus Hadarchaeota archaeon]